MTTKNYSAKLIQDAKDFLKANWEDAGYNNGYIYNFMAGVVNRSNNVDVSQDTLGHVDGWLYLDSLLEKD